MKKIGVIRSSRRLPLNVLKALLVMSGVFIFVVNADAATGPSSSGSVTITCAKVVGDTDDDTVSVEKAQITIASDGAGEIGIVQGTDMRYISSASCKPSADKKFDFNCEVTVATNQVSSVNAFTSTTPEGEKHLAIASLNRDGAVRTMTFNSDEECVVK